MLGLCSPPPKGSHGAGWDRRERVTPSCSRVAFEKPSPFPSLGTRLCCGNEMGDVTPVAQGSPQHNTGGNLLHEGICRKRQRKRGFRHSPPPSACKLLGAETESYQHPLKSLGGVKGLCPPRSSPLGPHGGRQQGWSREATKWVARGRLEEPGRDGEEGRTLLWPWGISFNGGNGGKNPPQRREEGERSREGEGGKKYTRGGVHGSLVQPGSSICKYIYASPHLRLGAFSWQMHKTPLAETPPPNQKPIPLRAEG